MLTNEQWKYIFNVIVIIGVLLFGFFLGRKTIKDPEPKVKIEYVKGDTITDTITVSVPYKVETPIDTANIIKLCVRDGIYAELFPTKTVTEYVYVPSKEDTTAIMKDWATKRFYSETLFNDKKHGNCVINAEVQYNRMKMVDFTYEPITQVITQTEYKTKVFSPFIGAGGLINPWDKEKMDPIVMVNAGFFIKEAFGLQLQYQHGFKSKNDFVGASFMYKF